MSVQKEHIKNYFTIHKTKFRNNFKSLKQSIQEDLIHDMRVSIKRLKLLYVFLDFYFDKQFKADKKFKILRKIFKSVAYLRDIQIQLFLLNDIEQKLNIELTKWKNELKKKESAEVQLIKIKLSKINELKLIKQLKKSKQLIDSIPTNTNINTYIADYFNKCVTDINQILEKDTINYHKVRKKIKALTYLTEIKIIQKTEQNEELNSLKQMGKLLGDWHDIDIFLKEQITSKNIGLYLKNKQNQLINNFNTLYQSCQKNYFINVQKNL